MTGSDFDLRVVRSDSRVHIAPVGELDIATAPRLEEAIAEATGQPIGELVLDLRELTFLDSTGLRALAQANIKAEQAGTALSIWRGPRQIERVLEISGLGPLLPLADPPSG
jgi:anti-sigma B factor antagonist